MDQNYNNKNAEIIECEHCCYYGECDRALWIEGTEYADKIKLYAELASAVFDHEITKSEATAFLLEYYGDKGVDEYMEFHDAFGLGVRYMKIRHNLDTLNELREKLEQEHAAMKNKK